MRVFVCVFSRNAAGPGRPCWCFHSACGLASGRQQAPMRPNWTDPTWAQSEPISYGFRSNMPSPSAGTDRCCRAFSSTRGKPVPCSLGSFASRLFYRRCHFEHLKKTADGLKRVKRSMRLMFHFSSLALHSCGFRGLRWMPYRKQTNRTQSQTMVNDGPLGFHLLKNMFYFPIVVLKGSCH